MARWPVEICNSSHGKSPTYVIAAETPHRDSARRACSTRFNSCWLLASVAGTLVDHGHCQLSRSGLSAGPNSLNDLANGTEADEEGGMAVNFHQVGQRLRAYRLGKNLTAADIASLIGVSRAAVYRLEKGELVKIETLEKLSELLDVSLQSLLGVGVEYYSNAVAFFERMRQLEAGALQILGNFSPISFLLLSDEYMHHLRTMLAEALPREEGARRRGEGNIERVLSILAERRLAAERRNVPVLSIVSTQDIERFLRFGLIGRFDLSAKEQAKRRQASRREVERFADLTGRQPIGIQIGVIENVAPAQTFQLFESGDNSAVTLSPYRLGELPNITSGIALVTSAPEAVRLFKETIAEAWAHAKKADAGAAVLHDILRRTRRAD
jgi:transcriptional regulator with XRE-family HTH domain